MVKNSVIMLPDTDNCIMLANGSRYKDVPILLTKENYDFLSLSVSTSFYIAIASGRIVYAYTAKSINGKRRIDAMHRLLTDCSADMVVDHHPNHYGLDNRYSSDSTNNNLTVVSNEFNNRNKVFGKRAGLIFFPKLTDPDSIDAIYSDMEKIKKLNRMR